MLAIERRACIKETIQEQKSVAVSDLARRFDVTEETIRRDLKVLESQGVLTRTYGGAFIQGGAINEVDVTLRETSYVDAKRQIAAQCLQLIRNGDSIFLDSSTTALEIARAIRDMRLTVLTNSLLIADVLSHSESLRLQVIGGVLQPQSMSFLGEAALAALAPYYVDSAFVSCRSVSLDRGITDSNEQSAAFRSDAIRRAGRVYLVADHTKFGQTSFVQICGFDALAGIVTDQPLSAPWHWMAQDRKLLLLENAPEA